MSKNNRTRPALRAVSDGRPPDSRSEERPLHYHRPSEECPPHSRRQNIHHPSPETRHPSTHHPSTHHHRHQSICVLSNVMSKEEVIHDGALDGCFSLVDPLVQSQTQTVGYSVLSESMSNGVNTNSSPHQLHLGGPSLVTVGFVTTHY